MRKIMRWFTLKDRRMALYIFNHWRNRTLEKFLSNMTHIGGSLFTVTTMTLVMLWTRFDYRGLLALTVSHCIVQVFKRYVPRKRPYDAQRQIILCGIPLKDFSFPSGHTSAVFTVASALSFMFPSLIAIYFGFAAIVGFSRIYLGYHYPSDVAIGALIGSGSAITVFML
jgi:undecaprenyl-diphosphatase